MVSQRELQEVVTQINGILERLDKRITALEKKQETPKKQGRPKNG
jgi:chaperonin cofactor prefoldin